MEIRSNFVPTSKVRAWPCCYYSLKVVRKPGAVVTSTGIIFVIIFMKTLQRHDTKNLSENIVISSASTSFHIMKESTVERYEFNRKQ